MSDNIIHLCGAYHAQVQHKNITSQHQEVIALLQESCKQLEANMIQCTRTFEMASEALENNLRVLELLTAEPQKRRVF